MSAMKILVVKTVDPAFDSLHEVFQMLGHDSTLISFRISFVEFKNTVETVEPDLIVINNTDLFSDCTSPDFQAFSDFLENGKYPVALWDFEAPYFVGGPRMMARWQANDYFRSFLFFHIDTFYVDEYRKHGNSAHYLPFFVDSRMENYRLPRDYENSFRHEITYIGTAFSPSIFRDECESDASLVDYFLLNARADLVNVVATYMVTDLSQESIQRIDAALFESYARFFKSDVHDAELTQRLDEALADFVTEIIAGEISGLQRRRDILRAVLLSRIRIIYSYFQVASRLEKLGDVDIHVYGEGEWNRILTAYPRPIRRLSYPELFAAFHNSHFIFGFTKKLFVNLIHERVFQILGAGGFPLFDHRRDFDLNFEPQTLTTYRSVEEIPEILKFYRKHEGLRNRQIEKARKQVFSRHTLVHRAEELLKVSGAHFGISTNSSRVLPYQLNKDWIDGLYHPPKISGNVSPRH